MKYENIVEGIFVDRPNRFIANVLIDGVLQRVHVKNTGRCKELLVEGAKVYLEDFKDRMGTRKLRYSLIAVVKSNKDGNLTGDILINMDSQAPNKMVYEAITSGKIKLENMDQLTLVSREKTYGDSRFDIYAEDVAGRKAFVEVKGVTLEKNGVAMFPDAPTERGVKHINGLIEAVKNGFLGYIILVIQLKGVSHFTPNYATHKAFGEALFLAENEGVIVRAYDSTIGEDYALIDQEIKIIY